MTSINFNAAATTALRTLQQTNSSLESTQNRVSTGLKIGEAKDNAAYWSISTTLKSDNKALGTVKDALNLGAATVDTAYQGLNKSLEVLNEIKSKVTAASQDGVDKQSLQSEITELQKQLTAIATSSSFSGENWLSTNSSVNGFNATKDVVSSFSRDGNNNVTLGSIKIDTSSFILVDGSGSKEGILDAGKSGNLLLTGGITGVTGVSATPAAAATITLGAITQPITAAGQFAGSVLVDGVSYNFNLTTTTATTSADIRTALNGAAASNGALLGSVATLGATSPYSITTTSTGANSTVSFDITTDGGTGLVDVAAAQGTAASAKVATTTGTFAQFTLDANDTIKFDVTVNGVAKTVKVDQDTITKALGATNGLVSTAAKYADVLNLAVKNAGISGVAVTAGSTIVFTGSAATTSLVIGSATASNGQSILNIDVTTASKAQLSSYLEMISTAADQVTTGAAMLGAVSARIELQNTFVSSLVDTIDKGVSNLIDADLSEESTKLQALQTKQQLGIQALSIANSTTQNILTLFRS